MLSVGKGGSKLKPRSGITTWLPAAASGAASLRILKLLQANTTTEQLAAYFGKSPVRQYNTYLNYEVIDSTKLEGAYDFDLEVTPSLQVADKGPDAITIFDAVSKQLGLKLELQNVPALPVRVDCKGDPNPTGESGGRGYGPGGGRSALQRLRETRRSKQAAENRLFLQGWYPG